jgi:hypothetical protein
MPGFTGTNLVVRLPMAWMPATEGNGHFGMWPYGQTKLLGTRKSVVNEHGP